MQSFSINIIDTELQGFLKLFSLEKLAQKAQISYEEIMLEQLYKYYLFLEGYEKHISDFSTPEAKKEYKAIVKLLDIFTPMLEKIHEIEDEKYKKFKEIIKLIVHKLQELEATLDIIRDERSRQKIEKFNQKYYSDKRKTLNEWDPIK